MGVEIPDFIRRAIEAQGKADPDEVAAKAQQIQDAGGVDALADPREHPPARRIVEEADRPEQTTLPLAFDDHELRARTSDPRNSHLSSASVGDREGSTATVTPGTHKHRILSVYANAERPLTDTEAWTQAGIDPRSGAWHRCSDLLAAGAIRHIRDIDDPETGSRVRTCAITLAGMDAIKKLDAGKTIKIGGDSPHMTGYDRDE